MEQLSVKKFVSKRRDRLAILFAEWEEFFWFISAAVPGKITRGQYGSEGYAAGGERIAILDCYN
jgi:hypothetical protein